MVKEGDKRYRDFLWGSTQEQRKISLVAWKRVCQTKKKGGLNIKSCRIWNKAVVGKLIWVLINQKEAL